MDKLRIDKWLWVARFYKTRALASEDIGRGRVGVNGQVAKASREIKPGDQMTLRQGPSLRTLVVRGLSLQRGPATVAQSLYEETPESIAARLSAADARRHGVEPATAFEQGRPSKRNRRQLADWQRWSASADSLPAEDPDSS